MKKDLYIKVVLTIIALCLIFSVLRDLGFLPYSIAVPVNNQGTVPVKIEQSRYKSYRTY